jgi:hypothetical protein
MKKAKKSSRATKSSSSASRSRDTMRREYDLTGGVRGKYAKAFAGGTNLVLLEPDLAASFTTAGAVNKALRAYLKWKSEGDTA